MGQYQLQSLLLPLNSSTTIFFKLFPVTTLAQIQQDTNHTEEILHLIVVAVLVKRKVYQCQQATTQPPQVHNQQRLLANVVVYLPTAI